MLIPRGSAPLLQVEGFLAWLFPRAANVQQLAITERRGDQLSDPVRGSVETVIHTWREEAGE